MSVHNFALPPDSQPLKACPNCHKGKPAETGKNIYINANVAIVHYACPECKQNIVNFRKPTKKEIEEETARLQADAEKQAAISRAIEERRARGE